MSTESSEEHKQESAAPPPPQPPARSGITAWLVNALGGDKERAKRENPPNRWLMMVPAALTHMCIGHPYAWSVMSTPLTRELGVVASAPADWALPETTMLLSMVFAFQGVAAAVAGPWMANIGPRASMALAAACFSGGLGLAAAGIAAHSLPLLYAGYGVLGGTGVGLAYTPPIQTLINWFPDRRGIASGVTIAGFGSGALVFVPVAQRLLALFRRDPQRVADLDAEVAVKEGSMWLQEAAGGRSVEVVEATATMLRDAGLSHLTEGYYAVGTGSTGTAETMAVMAAGYGAIMAASALWIRRPWEGYTVAQLGSKHDETAENKDDKTSAPPPTAGPAGNVNAATVLRTPQFWLMATTFFSVAAGGIGLLSVAKPLVKEVFATSGVASLGFASSFLMLLSVGNLGGRLGWAAVSDVVGRKAVFVLFTAGSIPIYLSAPWLVDQVVTNGSQAALAAYAAGCTLAVSFMGGTYALLPAYESDLFGSKHVGANHGRMLLASSAAALAGPSIIMGLRDQASRKAMDSLLAAVDPAAFAMRFRAPIEQAQELVASKRVTISNLLEICPAGTPDPTPYLYDSSMYTMTGLMAAATVAHLLVRPVDPKFFEENQSAESDKQPKDEQ